MTHAMLAITMSFILADRDPLCPTYKEERGTDSMIQQDLNLLIRDEATFRKLWCMHVGLDPTNERDLKTKPGVKVDFEKQMVVCVFRYDKRMPECGTALSHGKRVIRLIQRRLPVGVQQQGDDSEEAMFKPCYFVIFIFPKDTVDGFEQGRRWYDWQDSGPRTFRASHIPLRTDTLGDLKK